MKKVKSKLIKYKAVKEQFSINLRLARVSQGLTQENMEDKFNIELRYYQRLESGKANPTLETIALLSNCLNTKIEKLFKSC